MLKFALTAFATAFTIIDPIGMIPLTLVATAKMPFERRAGVVDLAVAVAAGVMLVMGVIGRPLLAYLGITLPAFLIAGGILLFLIAIDMLFGRPTGAKRTPREERDAASAENPAVFPLAIPMIAGPGTIATVLLFVNVAHGDRIRLGIVILANAMALLITWICMRSATRFMHMIGTTGVSVITRVLGIILAALAVQFVLNGIMQTPLVRAATTTSRAPRSFSGAQLESACVQYALYTWAAGNSVDGTPNGAEITTAASTRMAAIDRAYVAWTGPDSETSEMWDMRFNEAVCFVAHRQPQAAMPTLRALVSRANASAALHGKRNYAWPAVDTPERALWNELAIAQQERGDANGVRRSLQIGAQYPDLNAHAKPSEGQRRLELIHGTPCEQQMFVAPVPRTEIWWYCDARGDETEAYVFRSGRQFSHFLP